MWSHLGWKIIGVWNDLIVAQNTHRISTMPEIMTLQMACQRMGRGRQRGRKEASQCVRVPTQHFPQACCWDLYLASPECSLRRTGRSLRKSARSYPAFSSKNALIGHQTRYCRLSCPLGTILPCGLEREGEIFVERWGDGDRNGEPPLDLPAYASCKDGRPSIDPLK